MNGKLLHQPCVKIGYTYLIASTQKTETKVLNGGVFDLINLMMGGGVQSMMATKLRDKRLMNEVGSLATFSNCPHDDFGLALPTGAEGFDKSYDLLVQEKPEDDLSLFVEQDSIVRISTESSNAKNQIKAFIYMVHDDQEELLAWSKGGRASSSLMHHLKASKKPYRISLEYA